MKRTSSQQSVTAPKPPRLSPLATGIAALLLGSGLAAAQTYTSTRSGTTFTNPLVWNFGAGPVPVSDAGLALTFQSYGLPKAANDLNLTLNTINVANYNPLADSNLAGALSSTLGGGYAFTGAAMVNLLGSGREIVFSAPIVLASGATGLTFDGVGASTLRLLGTIASNTSTGAPLIIATDASHAGSGGVVLGVANSASGGVPNTFAGGVVLNSGTLFLGTPFVFTNNARVLGDRTNTLTINGGRVATRATTTFANNVLLNSGLDEAGSADLTLSGTVSGPGGVTSSASSSAGSVALAGINTYSGATTVRGLDFAAGAPDGAGSLRVQGAVGSILGTSGIGIAEGARVQLKYDLGNSAANTRVATGTAIATTGGFLEVIGNTGLVRQNLGVLDAGGLTTVLAATNGAGTATAGAGTEVTMANLQRGTGATVAFAGANLGGAAVAAGLAAAQGNVILTQINGAAAAAALVGGGGAAGTATMSILPWALGDAANTATNYAAGSGFVTYGANGVRLLNTTTEYDTGNNFTTAGATNNLRITGAVTSPVAPTTVNSIFFAGTGFTIGNASVLTITSGALASNAAAATISAPVNFGAGGAGEGIISVVDVLDATQSMTLSGKVTAASLVKSGNGRLVLSGTGNAIAGGITVNGGQISIGAVSQLGGATGLTFYGQSYAASRAGLTFTHTSGTQTLTVPVVTHGGMTGFSVTTAAATLALNSNITGIGGVRFDGAGTKTLGGSNTYTGGTYLGAGTLQIDSDARLGDATDPTANFLGLAGGTLRLTGGWTSARAITVDGATKLDTQASNAALSGPIVGTAALTKIGAGTLSITSPDNGYTGQITLGEATAQGGALVMAGAGALNSGQVRFGTGITSVAGTYLLDLSGATAASGTPWRSLAALDTASFFSRAHTVQLGNSALSPVDLRVGAGTFGGDAGVISGFGKLVKVGTGGLSLNGSTANTFTGDVEVWDGQLLLSADNQLGNGANGLVIKGGILTSTAAITSSRAVTLGATPQPVLSGSGTAQALVNEISVVSTLTLNGAISGAGGFNKARPGTLTLRTANSYMGDTQITEGTLSITDNSQLGAAGSRVRLSGGILQSAAGTAVTLPRTMIVTANSTVDAGSTAGGSLNLSGLMLGASARTLTKIGGNTLTVSGDNSSFFGTLAIGTGTPAGTVTLASTGQLRRGSITLNAGSSATFEMLGLTRELGSLGSVTGTVVALGAGGTLTTGFNNAAMTWGGILTGTGTAAVSKTGTANLTMQGNGHTFGGGFHLLSGTGDATLSLGGTLPLQSAFTLGAWGNSTNTGPTLVLDNTGTNLGTRLADTQIIHSNAGVLQFSTNTTSATSETGGSLSGAGMSTVTMTTGGTLNFGDATAGLSRVHGGTFLFRAGAATMGTAPASTTLANLTFGNLPGSELLGGAGGAGTATISILPYAVGGISGTDAGSNFVTYGANGIRVLNTTTETNNQVNVVTITSGATDNVRFANTTFTTTQLTGGADVTVNSLNLAGTASMTRLDSASSEKLIVTSGAVLNGVVNVFATNVAGTAGVPLGIQTAELQTGVANTRDLNVFTPADLALGARVTTGGGLTKSGAGALYLTNNANSYTGATTVNAGSLVVDSLAALGGSTVLQLGGGFFKYRGADAMLAPGIVAAGGSASDPNGGSAGFHVVSGTTLTAASGSVSGYGGVLKDGTGVLKLQGTNTYGGATLIAAGALAIDGPAALGSNSRVVFTNSTISASGGQRLRFDAPMTLTQDFITNTAAATVGFGFDTHGYDVTLNGTILSSTSTRGLYKVGAGELNLTATEMFTGATQVFGGTLRLSGAGGSIVNSTGTGGFNTSGTVLVNPGAALVLDNSVTNHNSRLPDVWETPFGSGDGSSGKLRILGGEFKIIGHAGGTSERTNQIDCYWGTVTLSGGGTTLTSGQFDNGLSTGLIRGTNLGGTPGPASTNWFVTDLGSGGVQLYGAGGAKDTPFVNIVRGWMGDTNATGRGTDFLTYSADVGFRTLAASEYTGTIPAGNFDLNRAPNVAISGVAMVNDTTTISALKLGDWAIVGGSGTLVLAQNTVLATGSSVIGVSSLSSNVSNGIEGYLFITPDAATTLTVNSYLPRSGIKKSGEGTLVLHGSYTGAVVVAQGTLRLEGASATLNPIGGSTISVMPGATLDLGGTDRTIGGLSTTNTVTGFSFLDQITDGTVDLGANRLTIYSGTAGSFGGNITGTGGVTLSFYSSLSNGFAQPQSYSGSTVIRGGTLRLAGAGTLASSAVEVRGGTLLFNNTDDLATTGYVADRIGTGTPITLAGGGVTFTENANTPANHQLGAVNLVGGGTLTLTNGSTAPSTLSIANLTRSAAHGTLAVSATGLGLAQSPVGGARVFLTQIEGATPAAALLGGGGAVGSTTQGILPWAASSTDGSFLTYGANGLRPLAVSEYESALDAPSGPDANVRITANQTLTAPRTVNSLLIAGGSANVGGSFDLTLNSGALAFRGASTFGTNTNALLTGAGNTRELVLANTSAATLNYNITASGGVTKSGGGTLTLGGTNTFIGGLAIHGGTVGFTADTQLGAPGGAIRFGSVSQGLNSLTQGLLKYNGPATTPLVFNRPVETTSMGAFAGLANHRWQINGDISGDGGIGYTTTNAVFEINGTNTYTGPTNWWGGHLHINGDSAFGDGGELILNASNQAIILRGNWTTSRLIHVAASSTIQTSGFEATWSGQFVSINGAPLIKSGTGSLVLTEPMTGGSPTIRAGDLVLKERGSVGFASVQTGGALVLDDTGTHFSDRVSDSSGVSLAGGALNVLGSSSVITEEVMNSLTLGVGAASIVTVAAGSGQAAIVKLTGALTVNAGASLWRGTSLGVNVPGTANHANIIMTETNALQQSGLVGVSFLTGGAAPSGHPSIGILRGAFGDTSVTGLGTQLVTYDLDRGIRLLNPATEFTSTLVNGSVVTDNIKAEAGTLVLPNATTANALWLKDGGSVTGAGTLTLTAGNLLVTGSGNGIANPVTAGANAFAIGGPGEVTLNGAVSGSGGLIKMGAGTLSLNTASTYTGTTVLAAGTVAVGNASAFGTTSVEFQGAAIRNATASPLTLANNLWLNGTMTVGGTQDLAFAGFVALANATREVNVTNTGSTTLSGVVSSNQALFNYGLTKTGAGVLVLSNPANTYDGPTNVMEGELRLTGSIAKSVLTIVDGGTLSGTGTIGALKTSAGTLSPGISIGTLNSGSVDFSGGTLLVELASASSADQLNATGTAGLSADTTLTISLLGGYDPQAGDQWVIVQNDGGDAFETGVFRFTVNSTPIQDNTPFTAGDETYVLQYNAGTGNDVVLTAVVPEPTTVALLLSGLPLSLRRRRALARRQ